MSWSKLLALEKVNQHNVAITAATDILSSTITIAYGRLVGMFRIMVAVDTGGVFSARVTKSSATVSLEFNGGVALTANSVYMFDMLVHSGDTVNFRHSATGNALVIRVQEIDAATQ